MKNSTREKLSQQNNTESEPVEVVECGICGEAITKKRFASGLVYEGGAGEILGTTCCPSCIRNSMPFIRAYDF